MTQRPRPPTRPPHMFGGRDPSKSAHKLYMRMSYLELERTRRQKELEALTKRANALRLRVKQIDDDIAMTQAEITKHPDGISASRLEEARKAVASRDVEATVSEGEPTGQPGFVIKY